MTVMRLKKKLSQSRRDFTGIYECEHCGHETQGHGYDDAHFHDHVIPDMACVKCGKTGDPSTPRTRPDVPAHIQI